MEANLFGLIQTTVAFISLLRKSPEAAILNVSSELGSNSSQSKSGQFHAVAYNASKAAVNSYTIALAHELKEDGIKVNAATPGYTQTRMTGYNEIARSSKEGAESLAPWVLLDKDGPTGSFFDPHGKEFPW